MEKVKTIASYTGLARYIATLRTKPSGELYVAGYLPNHLMPAHSRYSYSPAYRVYRTNPANGRDSRCVLWIETGHKIYEVWAIADSDLDSITSEEKATESYLAHKAKQDHGQDMLADKPIIPTPTTQQDIERDFPNYQP